MKTIKEQMKKSKADSKREIVMTSVKIESKTFKALKTKLKKEGMTFSLLVDTAIKNYMGDE